jgi:hypothetical protein
MTSAAAIAIHQYLLQARVAHLFRLFAPALKRLSWAIGTPIRAFYLYTLDFWEV